MTNDDLLAENAALKAALAARDAELLALTEHVAKLERLMRKTSTNSSAPPSSDPPSVERRKKEPTGRKPGGQPGHEGHARVRVQLDDVDHVVLHAIAGACPRCGGTALCRVKIGRRHQVALLLGERAEVTEHQCQRGRCKECGCRRHAALPPGVSPGCLGPRLQARLATMTGGYQLSRRQAEQYAREILHVDVSLGTVSNTEAVVSRALAPAYREAKAEVRKSEHVHVDETSFQRKGERTTTWVYARLLLAVLAVGKDRGRRALVRGLGRNYQGSLSTDRYVVYDIFPAGRRQLCWAHMLRAFVALIDEGGETGRVGRRLLRAGQRVIHLYNRHRRREIPRPVFERGVRRCRFVLEQLLGRHPDLPGLRTLAHAFWLTPESVWLFVARDDVPPTNNLAERDVRLFVLWKRRSFFTQSWRGDRFVERLMTVVVTCRKQARNLFDFVVETTRAALAGLPCPSLLPPAPS